ncbi:MAG TPA: hypothetical protein VNV25_25320 [Gemmatimonadaceae bacterium]|jgi:hypothetical protein|nr:hypothetical protein [Gemmatimonadaceae bacterium]
MIDIDKLIAAHRADLQELGEFNAYELLKRRIEAVRTEARQNVVALGRAYVADNIKAIGLYTAHDFGKFFEMVERQP